MFRERVFVILRDIDAVECELRRCEGRLSRLRENLRRELLSDRQATTAPEREQAVQR